jgi:hypothetical protein
MNDVLPFSVAESLKINTFSAGCCLSEVEVRDGMSSARQVFFGDFKLFLKEFMRSLALSW